MKQHLLPCQCTLVLCHPHCLVVAAGPGGTAGELPACQKLPRKLLGSPDGPVSDARHLHVHRQNSVR